MSSEEPTLIQILARISTALNSIESGGRTLSRALDIIGSTGLAEDVLLVRKQFKAGDDFVPVCLGLEPAQ